jgi:hypothetical protein
MWTICERSGDATVTLAAATPPEQMLPLPMATMNLETLEWKTVLSLLQLWIRHSGECGEWRRARQVARRCERLSSLPLPPGVPCVSQKLFYGNDSQGPYQPITGERQSTSRCLNPFLSPSASRTVAWQGGDASGWTTSRNEGGM